MTFQYEGFKNANVRWFLQREGLQKKSENLRRKDKAEEKDTPNPRLIISKKKRLGD